MSLQKKLVKTLGTIPQSPPSLPCSSTHSNTSFIQKETKEFQGLKFNLINAFFKPQINYYIPSNMDVSQLNNMKLKRLHLECLRIINSERSFFEELLQNHGFTSNHERHFCWPLHMIYSKLEFHTHIVLNLTLINLGRLFYLIKRCCKGAITPLTTLYLIWLS